MKNALLLLGLVALPFCFGSSPSAIQHSQGAPLPPHPPALGVDRGTVSKGDACFQGYFRHVKQCRDEFCPNRIFNCDETSLRACIDGAKEVLKSCLQE